MRAVIQRVSSANVAIAGKTKATINNGLLVLLGIEAIDTQEDIDWLCRKITAMRIFDDEKKQMNLSVKDIGGEIMVISQFTLHASTKKGNRPSFIKAAKPDIALPLYHAFLKKAEEFMGKTVQAGIFGADMKVSLCNDGPITIIMDSKNKE